MCLPTNHPRGNILTSFVSHLTGNDPHLLHPHLFVRWRPSFLKVCRQFTGYCSLRNVCWVKRRFVSVLSRRAFFVIIATTNCLSNKYDILLLYSSPSPHLSLPLFFWQSNSPGSTLRHPPSLLKMLSEELQVEPVDLVDLELCLTDTQPSVSFFVPEILDSRHLCGKKSKVTIEHSVCFSYRIIRNNKTAYYGRVGYSCVRKMMAGRPISSYLLPSSRVFFHLMKLHFSMQLYEKPSRLFRKWKSYLFWLLM